MARKKTLTALFDLLGAGGLLAAGIALLDATSILPVLPQADALQLFSLAFFGAVTAFGIARTLQIAQALRERPLARRAPVEQAAPTVVEPTPAPNPFQRAA
jgi:hypothetical protein